MTATIPHVTALLDGLGKRARTSDGKPDLSPAIGIVNDLGRLVARGTEPEIRQAQAAVAALREQLNTENALNFPAAILTGPDSHNFLAGALWAVNELITAQLESLPSAVSPRMTRRDYVKDKTLFALRSGAALSPKFIREAIGDASVRADEVSRALGEMLAARLVEVVSPAPGSDRRLKCFALTSEGREARKSSASGCTASD